jgi:hypothetical protein
MKAWIAFWNIVLKDMRAYYLKPPNVSWGLIFPIAWTAMFFIKPGRGLEDVLGWLPGVVAISILFGATSMLAVTATNRFSKGSKHEGRHSSQERSGYCRNRTNIDRPAGPRRYSCQDDYRACSGCDPSPGLRLALEIQHFELFDCFL